MFKRFQIKRRVYQLAIREEEENHDLIRNPFLYNDDTASDLINLFWYSVFYEIWVIMEVHL